MLGLLTFSRAGECTKIGALSVLFAVFLLQAITGGVKSKMEKVLF
jgi:hypothetical protein